MRDGIHRRLAGARSALRRAALLYGAAVVVVAAVAGLLLFGSADWLLRASAVLRTLFLLTLAGGVGWCVYRYLWLPLTVPVRNLDLALQLERLHPELGERLSSTVDFLDHTAEDPRYGSPQLRGEVIDAAGRHSDGVDFAEIVQTRPVRKMLAAAGAAVAAGALTLALFQTSAGIALTRLLLPWGQTQWPLRTQLERLSPPDRIAKGDPFEMRVRAAGDVPEDVTLDLRFDDGATAQAMLEPDRVEDEFVGGLETVQQPFEYRLSGGDAISDWFPVQVVPAPVVDRLAVRVTFPDYTGLAPLTLPEGRGHVEAVVGSTVELTAASSKGLTSAEIRFADDSGRLPATVDDDRRTVHARFPVTEDTTYQIMLGDTEGMSNARRLPRRYRIRAIKDLAPEITLETPEGDVEVTPEATVPIAALVKDDFGIGGIDLVHQLDKSGPVTKASEETVVPLRPAAEAVATEKRLLAEHSWDLAPMRLAYGTVLRMRLRAADLRDVPEPNVGFSREVRLRVVGTAEFLDAMENEQKLVREELQRVLGLQTNARDTVAELREQAAVTGALDRPQAERLQAAEMVQRRVAEKIAGSEQSLLERIRSLLARMEANKVEDVDSTKRLSLIRSELSRIGEQNLPPIEQALTAARKQTAIDKANGKPADRQPTNPQEAGGPEQDSSGKNGVPDQARAAGDPAESGKTGGREQADESGGAEPSQPGEAAGRNEPEAGRSEGQEATGQEASGQEQAPAESGPKTDAEPDAAGRPEGEMSDDGPTAADDNRLAGELAKAGEQQEKVVESLDAMLQQLGKWENVAQVVNDARSVQRRQADVKAQAQRLADRTLGKRDDELDPETRAELAKTAARQEAARQELGRLQEKMQRLAAGDAAEDPVAAQTMQDAARELDQSNAAGKMGEAAGQIRENRMGEAARNQDQVERALQDLVENMQDSGEKRLERMIKQVKQAERDLQQIKDEQLKLRKKTEDAQKIADPQQREAELRRLRKQQEELQRKAEEFARRLSKLQADKASRQAGRAASRMQQAGQQMQQGDRQQAGARQDQAADELEQAEQQLAQKRQELEAQLAEEQLAKVADSITQLYERELALGKEIDRLEALRQEKGRLTRGQVQSVISLSRVQRGLAEEAGSLGEQLDAAKVFERVIRRGIGHMEGAADALGQRRTDADTRRRVDRAAAQFALLLESLKPDPAKKNDRKQDGQQGQQGQQGGQQGGGGDGIPGIAQIKLLKLLQTTLVADTEDLLSERGDADQWTDEQKGRIGELGQRQGELADLIRELSEPPPEEELLDEEPADAR